MKCIITLSWVELREAKGFEEEILNDGEPVVVWANLSWEGPVPMLVQP